MEISEDRLEELMHMSRLYFSSEERAAIHKDLNKIVVWVKKLEAVNTAGVHPLVTMSDEVNRLRSDVPQEALPCQKGLLNAPDRNSDYFQVPVVVKE